MEKSQSGFRPHHSTETSPIKMLNDIWLNTESGEISVLVLPDLNAAFETINHRILLDRLENGVGLPRADLDWFKSYLEGRSYFATIGWY